MSDWKKLPPVSTDEIHHGCLTCGGTAQIAHLDSVLAVGFGTVQIMRDNECLYDEASGLGVGSEDEGWDRFPSLKYFESMAKADPDHDWRYIIDGPLRGAVYQRQGLNRWVLIKSDPGFA